MGITYCRPVCLTSRDRADAKFVITVFGDALAPNGARPSAGTVLTKARTHLIDIDSPYDHDVADRST